MHRKRYYVCNGLGESLDEPARREMQRFLDGLDPDDVEHGAAWVADGDGNALEYAVTGTLCFDRDGRAPRHLDDVPVAKVLELWGKLADGRFDDLEREPWRPGTREPATPRETALREGEIEAWRSKDDRSFYDGLGPERSTPCRAAGCTRGAVALSVFCRPHHFASVRGRPSPFDD
ncbi:MAG TPA: hypothetical protein VHB21_15840 [Minicystis sp.]|nr:hypothetical protein [Minicystis sp.]